MVMMMMMVVVVMMMKTTTTMMMLIMVMKVAFNRSSLFSARQIMFNPYPANVENMVSF